MRSNPDSGYWPGSGYITGVEIVYDEANRDPLKDESIQKQSVSLDGRSELDIDPADHTYVRIVRDDELLEIEGPTTFTLPPGEYEIWADGENFKIDIEDSL